jgi:hypothetical protein
MLTFRYDILQGTKLGLLRIAFAGITSQHRGKGRQVGSAP